MYNTQAVDFYVDDQNRAIPGGIAQLYLEEILSTPQPSSIEPEVIVSRVVESNAKSNSWLGVATILTGLSSAGVLCAQFQPGFIPPLSAAPTPVVSSGVMNIAPLNHSPSLGLATPTAPANFPLERSQRVPATPVAAATVSSTRAVPSNLLQQAHTLAQRAVQFSQTARSVDDWGIAAGQWQKAIAVLGAIPRSSADFAIAQQRLAAYQKNLRSAQQKANQPIVEAPMPTTRIQIMNGVVCRPNAAPTNAAKVELFGVKFKAKEQDSTEGSIVGCITNRTKQPIRDLALVYRAISTKQPNLVQAGSEHINIPNVAPGQTVAFRTRMTLNPTITNIKVEAISWIAAEGTEPQTVATAIDLAR